MSALKDEARRVGELQAKLTQLARETGLKQIEMDRLRREVMCGIARLSRAWSQTEVAKQTGIGRGTIKHYLDQWNGIVPEHMQLENITAETVLDPNLVATKQNEVENVESEYDGKRHSAKSMVTKVEKYAKTDEELADAAEAILNNPRLSVAVSKARREKARASDLPDVDDTRDNSVLSDEQEIELLVIDHMSRMIVAMTALVRRAAENPRILANQKVIEQADELERLLDMFRSAGTSVPDDLSSLKGVR